MELFGAIAVIGFVIFLIIKNADSKNAPKAPPADRPTPTRSAAAPRPQRKAIVSEGAKHPPAPEIPTSRELKGKAWVIDGDTIVVSKVKVRLAGIDAPELNQPWGQKSKWEMVNLCKERIVRVELTGETSYDRLVGTCYLPDGRDIGAEIVKAGLALDGGHFSKGKYEQLECPDMRRKLKTYGRWR